MAESYMHTDRTADVYHTDGKCHSAPKPANRRPVTDAEIDTYGLTECDLCAGRGTVGCEPGHTPEYQDLIASVREHMGIE